MKLASLLALLAGTLTLASILTPPQVASIRGSGQRPDILIADFEGDSYAGWEVQGSAFGTGPARGALPNQQAVRGFRGRGLINSYVHGDASTGALLSAPFVIKRRRINFLIGGGRHPGQASLNLLLDGKVVRTATGRDSEMLLWSGWDVSEYEGRTVRIQFVDEVTGGWGHLNVDHIVQSDSEPVNEDDRDGAIQRAEESVRDAARRAETDPTRPVYHFRAPGNWMNDPNGPFWHKGWYHLFYQHNPYGDQWGNMHWGHARSRDLLRWEHLPIALWPSLNKGEEHVFSGSAALDRKGIPALFYTSIGHSVPEMWAAQPEDPELIRWRKLPGNPILTATSQGTKFDDWRDPYVFEAGGKTFLIHGGNLNQAKGGQAVVALYRARNPELTDWEYRGILFRHPDAKVVNIECPNFFALGRKWVLITSPHRACDYFVGDFDPVTEQFTLERSGMVDFSDQFYAPNGLSDPKGRRIIWGWIRGFKEGRGWNGCLSLPRVLSIAPDGVLRQEPAPELRRLRGRHAKLTNVRLEGTSLLPLTDDCLEMTLDLDLLSASRAGIRLRRFSNGGSPETIAFDGSSLDIPGQKIPVRPNGQKRRVNLRIYFDKSVLEVFVNGGRECATRVIYPGESNPGLELFSEGGEAHFRSVDAWEMKSIW